MGKEILNIPMGKEIIIGKEILNIPMGEEILNIPRVKRF
jgi:hypothetical protein